MDFTISDDGVGIPDERKAEVFEPFRRLQSKEEVPGSGLGLSICKKIVERHGGRIWLESREGGGTKAVFTVSANCVFPCPGPVQKIT